MSALKFVFALIWCLMLTGTIMVLPLVIRTPYFKVETENLQEKLD